MNSEERWLELDEEVIACRRCARLAAYREAGVTTLNVVPIGATPAERIKLIETLRQLL